MVAASQTGFTLYVNLLPEIDAMLRKTMVRRRGDVRRIILEMFETCDLNAIEVPEMRFEGRSNGKPTTVLNVPNKYHRAVKQAADLRGCSMNAVINGGIKAYMESARQAPGKRKGG